jgi:dTDP-glucose 4,6-dehydratase
MSKISVFGSSGFIGKRFTELYPNETVKVKREENKASTDNLLYLISTVDNYNIHNNLHIDIDTNLSKLMDVIKANKNENLVFNFVSSWFVYGQNPNIPFNEENTIISRKKNALQFLINEAVHDRDLHLYYGGEVLRDYIYIDDVCSAIKLCLDTAPTNQIINIGSGRPSKFLDIIEKTLEKSNSKSRIIDIQPTVFHNIVQTKHSYLDIKKLKSYGFKQKYSMDNIIDKLVDYYRKND